MGAVWSSCPRGGCADGGIPKDLVLKKTEHSVKVDFERVMDHALRSWAAYHKPEEIESGVFKQPVSPFGNNSVSREVLPLGSLGLFLEHQKDGTQWVCVRGTDNLANVKDDIRYNMEHSPDLGIRVHKGFLSLYAKAWDDLHSRLDKTKPIKLTGHSLGGAVAALLSLRLKKAGYRLMETVTFGAPKFTDFAGSVQYIKHQVPLLRITNKGDPVPAGPPWDDYVHAGAEVHLFGDDPITFRWINGSEATVDDSEAAGKFWKHMVAATNHRLVDYLQNIWPKMAKRNQALETALKHYL
uniref:Fungal lipase-type domain-containing protein n=1 Tax=Eutreptiella gymnastica TaxID=73025 RepID=A0A7S4GHJ3_9EUGL|mmetsp:Transcript_52810/g.86743  ORF Transcript_52810/g.86743 Transcript_52810/m.86743 type:complete len:297 (+) Transcript_52810:25-915(+)